jgi:phospholipase C
MLKNHRRAFLRNALKTSAFAAAFPAVSKILEAAPATGHLSSVSHVVFFMQENRSFDHYLGTMSGIRG